MARGEPRAGQHDALRQLAGETIRPRLVVALRDHVDVGGDPFARDLMGRVAGAEREVHEERLLGITDFWSRTNEIARFEKEMPEDLQRSLRAEAAEEVDGLIRDMLVLRAQQRQSKSWIGRFLTS
jgi:hypothetical protein